MATTATELPGAMTPVPFAVARRKRETADTWTLELEPRGGEPLELAPGQFTMLYAFGIGEVPISVSGDVSGPLVHTVRAVGPVSQAICGSKRGAVLGVRGPFGNSWPVDEAIGGDAVVIAGGIGLAPLRPVVYDVLRRRKDFGEAVLLYGSRRPAELLYAREIERWRRQLQVDLIVDAADQTWIGKVGFVAKLVAGAHFDPRAATAFICGPELMMRTSAEALIERGLSPTRIFVSMERNMKCAVGLCGHCQFGPLFVCVDGPVFQYARVAGLLQVREV